MNEPSLRALHCEKLPTPRPDPPECKPTRSSSPDQRFYFILLPSQDRSKLLVQSLPDACVRLPVLETSVPVSCQTSDPIEDTVSQLLGVPVALVRVLWRANEDADIVLWDKCYHTVAVLLVECYEPECTINCTTTKTKWLPRCQVSNANWVATEQNLNFHLNQVVFDAMKEINGEIHPRIPPWQHMGWRMKMMKWVKHVLNPLVTDQEHYAKFEMMASNHHSVVWGYNCEDQAPGETYNSYAWFYVKAALPEFSEAQRTAAIARVIGDIVPEVIAVHQSGTMWLMGDAGILDEESGEYDGDKIVQTITTMQQMSRHRLHQLRAGGVEVRDSKWVIANIHRILFDDNLQNAVHGVAKYENILRKLRSCESEIIRACNMILSYDVPNTLVHGDLGLHNIGTPDESRGRGYQFFDWDCACIGHPFVDIKEPTRFSRDKASTDRLYHEYWKTWSSIVSKEDFLKLIVLVQFLEDAMILDMFLKESQLYDYNYDLTKRMRYSLDYLMEDLNDVKQYKPVK